MKGVEVEGGCDVDVWRRLRQANKLSCQIAKATTKNTDTPCHIFFQRIGGHMQMFSVGIPYQLTKTRAQDPTCTCIHRLFSFSLLKFFVFVCVCVCGWCLLRMVTWNFLLKLPEIAVRGFQGFDWGIWIFKVHR
jgi:hypothetical protein